MPAMTNGTLCQARGTVYAPTGEAMDALYVKVVQGTTPTDLDIVTNYNGRVAAQGAWTLDVQLPACAGPNSTLISNTLCAVTRTYTVDISHVPPVYVTHYRDRVDVTFNGQQGTC
jgi:hypothetical protein